MDYPWRYRRFSTQISDLIASAPCTLISVIVNTGATSAVFTLFDGSSTSATTIATIDASAANQFFYGCVCETALFGRLASGNADVTVVYVEAHLGWVPAADYPQ